MPYSAYTSAIQMTLDNITWEDENFIEELLEIAQLFRPFSVAITEFISDHGYDADPSDVEAKVAYIRAAFEKANIWMLHVLSLLHLTS